MSIRGLRWLSAAVIAAALGLAPNAAFSQAQPVVVDEGAPPPADDELAPADVPADDASGETYEGEGETIVITGSGIERRVLTTPAPVAVLSKVELESSGLTSIGDILQNLPSQSNAINTNTNNGGDGSTRVNLRGLGTNRTLVLVNGRRHVPGGTGANASVDLGVIPLSAIERIEVLKDGASAIYGSDAIGGVVNIILRTDLQGTETSIYTGSTEDGLGTIYDLSVTTGHKTDRGNILFSAGVYEQKPMFAGDRDYATTDKVFNFAAFRDNEDPNLGESDFVNTLGSTATPQGYINDRSGDEGNALWQMVRNGACSDGVCFNDPLDGWRNFNFDGVDDPKAGGTQGDLYNYQPENYLVTPQQRYNLFSAGNYQFHDNVRGFFEATYTNRKSDQLLAPTPLFIISEGLSVSADNFYNPFGRSFRDVRRRFIEAGNRRFLQDLDTFRVVGGLDGSFPSEASVLADNDWKWSLSYNFGRTEGTNINEGRFVRSRVEAALGPSFLDSSGVARCGTPEAPVSDCVPLNLFGGVGTITDEMVDYISYVGTARGFNEQQSVLFTATGKLADTPWDGDVRLAMGAQYRDEAGAFIPDPLTASGDTTGNKQDPVEGGYDVREAYAELSIVPITGRPGAEWIEINGAVRAFDYSTFGGGTTWKTGGLWRIMQGLSVRGTYSTAFRAPNVGELFSGQADAFPNVTDPCDIGDFDPSIPEGPDNIDPRTEAARANCSADGLVAHRDDRSQLRALEGGNPELQVETAITFTAGVVYEPKPVPGLALTLDYFNIALDQTITTAGAAVLLDNCYGTSSDDRSDCDKIIRDENGLINVILDTATNIGARETAGVDIAIRYDHKTVVGRFVHNLEGTWLQKFDETLANGRVLEGRGVYDIGVFPEWKFNYSTMWGYGSFGGGVSARYIGSFKECDGVCDFEPPDDDPEAPPPGERKVSANVTADLFGSYTIRSPLGDSRLSVGVNNVLDAPPAVIYNGFLATSDADTYDFLGRFFYARFLQKF